MGFCNLIIETKTATVTAAQTLYQTLNQDKSFGLRLIHSVDTQRLPIIRSAKNYIYCALSHLNNSTQKCSVHGNKIARTNFRIFHSVRFFSLM